MSDKDQFHCSLELYDGKFHSEAVALTKKLAKHETAKSMLFKLSEHKEDVKEILSRNKFDQTTNNDSGKQPSKNTISLLDSKYSVLFCVKSLLKVPKISLLVSHHIILPCRMTFKSFSGYFHELI